MDIQFITTVNNLYRLQYLESIIYASTWASTRPKICPRNHRRSTGKEVPPKSHPRLCVRTITRAKVLGHEEYYMLRRRIYATDFRHLKLSNIQFITK